MKSFVFRLESLLTLRAIAEQKAMEQYGLARQRQTKAEEAFEEGHAELDALSSGLAERQRQNINSTDQQLYWNAIKSQELFCKQLAEAVNKALKDSDLRLAALLEAKKGHDILSRLKETRKEMFQQKVYRHDEITLEDLISAQHARKLSEASS